MTEDTVSQEPITSKEVSREHRILRGQIKKTPRDHGKALRRVAEEKLKNERELAETRTALEKTQQEATRDSLTNLFNEKYFSEYLSTALATIERQRQNASVLFLDLDRFKETNDKMGHAAGDQVLKEVAEIFRKILRDEDVSARKGGDEFVIFLPRASTDQALAVAKRIANAAKENLKEYGTTTSIGVASYEKGMSSKELIAKADTAMYASKEAGGNTATEYKYGMQKNNSTTRAK